MSTSPSAAAVRRVRARDAGRCRRCGGPGTNTQHRVARGMGGTSRVQVNDLSNLVTVCGSGTTGCHGWMTAHPADAYATGWAVRRNGNDLPSKVPLTDLDGHQFFLTEDGAVVHLNAIRSEQP